MRGVRKLVKYPDVRKYTVMCDDIFIYDRFQLL